MKGTRNILIAFILNLVFSVFELLGGFLTGSVAILSDAVHDAGDAASIGIAYFLERKSKVQPDENFTYGYGRYSVLGSLITTAILIIGSVVVICNAFGRLFEPVDIHYNGMLVFAVAGVCINLCAAFFTRKGHSLNEKAVNLHMLEDVLGWAVVLIGAVIIRITELSFIDPLLSIAVSVYILIHALGNLKESLTPLLEKAPQDITAADVKRKVDAVDGILDVHHIHVWTLDGRSAIATLHIVTDGNFCEVKTSVREQLAELGIVHTTIETEKGAEQCAQRHCHIQPEDMPLHTHCHSHGKLP